MTLETTAPADGQTPAPTEETVQTPAQPEEKKEETISKSEVTRLLKKQAAELTAKYKPFEEKARKFEEAENAKLKDDERAAKRLKDLENQIAEKEKELAERTLRDLKRSKIEQAIADGKMEMPKGKTIDSLVKRCLGTNEDEITSDVEELIGFFPKAEPPKGQGIGTQVDTGSTKQNKTLDDEIAELKMALASPPIGLNSTDLRNYKEQTAKRLLALNNRKMMNFSRSE